MGLNLDVDVNNDVDLGLEVGTRKAARKAVEVGQEIEQQNQTAPAIRDKEEAMVTASHKKRTMVERNNA